MTPIRLPGGPSPSRTSTQVEGYYLYWGVENFEPGGVLNNVDDYNNFDGVYANGTHGSWTFTILPGYTYSVQACVKQGNGCGLKSQIVQISVPDPVPAP
jgi:hypothetical protein